MSNGQSVEKPTPPLKLLGSQSSQSIISELSDFAMVIEPRENFDLCIIGVCGEGGAIYDADKVLDTLVQDFRQDPTLEGETTEAVYEIALEHYCYNILGSYFGGNSINPTFTDL